MDAVSLHQRGWQIFEGGGLWHWPLLVLADLGLGGGDMFWRSAAAFIAGDFGGFGHIFWEFGGVGFGGRSTLSPCGFSMGVVFCRRWRRLLLAVFGGVGKSSVGVDLFRWSWI